MALSTSSEAVVHGYFLKLDEQFGRTKLKLSGKPWVNNGKTEKT